MNVIVPLAGPDFEREDGSVKGEQVVEGRPLLRAALEQRSWFVSEPDDLIFVLRENPASQRFAHERLACWYPWAKTVWVSDFTAGAAFSALAANLAAPVIIDLCDILFDCDVDPAARFASDPQLGGLAIVFPSEQPQYSYLELAEDGRMVRAREKAVISAHASAGVYGFRNAAVFWDALGHSTHNREDLAHRGALYVCPMLNGVVARGLDVRAVPATQVRDVKTLERDPLTNDPAAR